MKKTYSLIHPKINVARRVEAIKHEIKKYQIRERKKPLPKGADFWDFNCKFGTADQEPAEVHTAEINKLIDGIEAQGLESFYIEVIAIARNRTQKPAEVETNDDNDDDDDTNLDDSED